MNSKKHLDNFKPASTEFEFREYPFYWVMRLGNLYTQKMEVQLKKKGMNITSWRIGLILKENGVISMTEIAKHAVGRLPTITKSVYKMQEMGLVKVHQSENDGRVTMVSITDLGLQTIQDMITNTAKIIDRAFDGFKKSEATQLNNLLQKIYRTMSDD